MVKFELVKRDFVWIGLIVVLIGIGFVYAYGGSQPSVVGHSSGEIVVDNALCNRIMGQDCGGIVVDAGSNIDFSVAGSQKAFTCANSRQTQRGQTAPGAGVKGAIFNLYKTSGRDVRGELFTTGGTSLGRFWDHTWEDHADADSDSNGDFVIIPVDANGYFAIQCYPGRDASAGVRLTQIAYIY
jgi:hypothetical protein